MANVFYIKEPHKLKTQFIYYNSSQNKVKLLQNVMLNYWERYCNEHWIWLYKFKDGVLNYEDKTKFFLNKCADFLLLGESKKGKIVTNYKNKKILNNEVSLSGDWESDKHENTIEEVVDYFNLNANNDIILQNKHKNKPQSPKKRFNKETKISKIHKIYHKPSKIKRKYYKLTNKEVYDRNNIQYPKFDTEKELKKWKKRKYKNICGECVWDYKNIKIKSYKGLIDKNKPHKVKWCLVNTDNEFEFDNNKYIISDKVEQYNLQDDIYIMDKVLVYQQDNNMYFFDQEINRIDNNLIKKQHL